MVPPYQIHNGKDRCTHGHRVEGMDVRDGEPISLGGGIEAPVVSTRAATIIGLLHHVER